MGKAHPVAAVVVGVENGSESVSCIESSVYIVIGRAHAHDFVVCMAEKASGGAVGVVGSVSSLDGSISHALDSGSCRTRVADVVVWESIVGGWGRIVVPVGSLGHFGVSVVDMDGMSHTSHCRVCSSRSEKNVDSISSWGTVSWVG